MGAAPHAHELVFPAHAGMSPVAAMLGYMDMRFPRTRGDEPASNTFIRA